MSIKYKKEISIWDNRDCGQHVVNLVGNIFNIFKEKNISEISYIDIGANVGKVYDLLSKLILIKKAWMYEASPILFKYLEEKYINNNSVSINNFAITDIDGVVDFDEDTIMYQIENNASYFNFGLSKINQSARSSPVQAVKLSNIIKNNAEITDTVSFIKIDTENTDFKILKDISEIIPLFKIKPIIEFECNHKCSNLSDDDAQKILNLFREHYQPLDIKKCHGDGILLPL